MRRWARMAGLAGLFVVGAAGVLQAQVTAAPRRTVPEAIAEARRDNTFIGATPRIAALFMN